MSHRTEVYTPILSLDPNHPDEVITPAEIIIPNDPGYLELMRDQGWAVVATEGSPYHGFKNEHTVPEHAVMAILTNSRRLN
jgi:hypothetical protein